MPPFRRDQPPTHQSGEPVSGQEPLRLLDRHRPDRRLLWGQRSPPAVPRREPSDQPGVAHHGHSPAAQCHRRPRLLRPHQKPVARRPTSRCGCSNAGSPTDIVYRTMVNDAARHMATGPGGQPGNDSDSSAASSQPHTPALRKSHFPDPPPPRLRPRCQSRLDTEGSQKRTCQPKRRSWSVPGSAVGPRRG